jgi:hypothetical protein
MQNREAEEVSANDEPTTPAEAGDTGHRVINSTQIENKYEAAIVAAQEARRLNDITRVTGESLSARVTQMAIENVRAGNVNYEYEEPVRPAPAPEPEE